MKNFVLLLQFFTRIPIKKIYPYDHESYGKSTFLLPLVGFIIGSIIFLSGKIMLLTNLPKELYSLALLFLWIILTGALHLDGFADTIDGFFSYKPKDKVLEIMRDPHIGTNGVIGLIFIILTKFFLYSKLNLEIIFLSFILGRLIIIMSASFGNYARDKGMAIAIIQYNNKFTFIKSFFISLIIFIFFKKYIISFFLTLIIGYFIHLKIIKKIDGVTGDTLGFLCETSEVIFLILTILIK